MPDEYVAHYSGFSHAQLYSQLQAGNPEQLETLAANWISVSDSLDSVSGELKGALQKLQNGWKSDSGTEFANRVGPIATFASDLSVDSATINRGFKVAASNLRDAQKKAEDPAETDDNDSALGFAAVGTAVAGPVGGAVGAKLGHDRDVEQKEKAKARMVAVVAALSGEYDLTVNNAIIQEAQVPVDLPGSGDGHVSRKDSPRTHHVSSPGSPVGGGINGSGSRLDDPSATHGYAVVSHGSGSGDGSGSSGSLSNPGITSGSGFGSGGAGTGLTGTVDSTSLSDYESSGTSLSGAGGPGGGGTGLLGPSSGPSGLSAPGGVPAGGAGGLGGGGGLAGGGLLGGGSLGGNAGFSGSAGRAGNLGQAANSTALNSASRPGSLSPGADSARQPLTGAGNRSGVEARNAMGYRGQGDTAEDETDERSTWLTEDDMVWTGNDDVAPGVLGA